MPAHKGPRTPNPVRFEKRRFLSDRATMPASAADSRVSANDAFASTRAVHSPSAAWIRHAVSRGSELLTGSTSRSTCTR